jgi:hypothetical protein
MRFAVADFGGAAILIVTRDSPTACAKRHVSAIYFFWFNWGRIVLDARSAARDASGFQINFLSAKDLGGDDRGVCRTSRIRRPYKKKIAAGALFARVVAGAK